jgi:glycerophosphoryl diester phosphodiesterase
VLVTGAASAAGLLGACSPSKNKRATTHPTVSASQKVSSHNGLVDKLSAPFFIAHRGGAARYPEHSLRAYKADARAGFLIELDVQLLADGTAVVIHDPTVDRTMTGHGKVKDLTPRQWEKMRIKPVEPGGKPARPQFYDDILDKFGGKHVIVPEIKSHDAQHAVIYGVVKRKQTRDVIVQSFFYNAAVAAADAGIPAMWLTSKSDTSKRFSKAAEAGITYIGYESSLPRDYVRKIVNSGMKPVAWTVDSIGGARKQFDAGAVGLFSNNPWKLTKAHY